MKKSTSTPKSGIVVPIDIQAHCIGTDPGAVFNQAPFNFEKLKSPPYLSETAKLTGQVSMEKGVHLHWALPDAINHGVQKGASTDFLAIPDRWMITRVLSTGVKNQAPIIERWVLESNFTDKTDPNKKSNRFSVTAPNNPFDEANKKTLGTPWRYLGRVQPLDSYLKGEKAFDVERGDEYLDNLTTVGYGTADFSAFYQNSMSVLGFNDLAPDLLSASENDDKHLSYHILGWYSDPSRDPVRALPEMLHAEMYDQLLGKLTETSQKDFFKLHYKLTQYGLDDNITQKPEDRLEKILTDADYPFDQEPPQIISESDFEELLTHLGNQSDKDFLKQVYFKQYQIKDITESNHGEMWNVLNIAGYDFMGECLKNHEWSLPASKSPVKVSPEYSIYSGVLTGITWNKDKNFFESIGDGNYNVAIGNTPQEALSALVANSGSFDDPELVEDVLNALQSGLLEDVRDESILKDWRKLKNRMFQDSFGSNQAGYLWEIHDRVSEPQDLSRVSLKRDLAVQLNELNLAQQAVNELTQDIKVGQQQIFQDWYKFMLIYHGKYTEMNPNEAAEYLEKKVEVLDQQVVDRDIKEKELEEIHSRLNNKLPNGLVVHPVSAPRYWRPNDPVVLIQGNGLNVADRFGNDGRLMYNDTLLCRDIAQLNTSVDIPANSFGNAAAFTISEGNFPSIPNDKGLRLIDALNSSLVDSLLSDRNTLAQVLLKKGSTDTFSDLVSNIQSTLDVYLNPEIPENLSVANYDQIVNNVNEESGKFMERMYQLDTGTNEYKLKHPVTDLDKKDVLHLKYLFTSTQVSFESKLNFDGIATSQIAQVIWTSNPWLPFAFNWRVHYFPFKSVGSGAGNYPTDVITSNFTVGEDSLEYSGPEKTLSYSGLHPYTGNIFLTPHANINLAHQIEVFIDHNKDSPVVPQLKSIKAKLSELPILSQALSGFNEELQMLQSSLQLSVADPDAERQYYRLTNEIVNPAVGDQNTVRPEMNSSFNPVRAGLAQLMEINLTDVFGWNKSLTISSISRSLDLKQSVLEPKQNVYFPPRLSQPARLLFRWLSASDDTVEMNTHPASSPICGWVLANHYDNSLWVYNSKGDPYGSFILNEDNTQIIWQSTPAGPYFGLTFAQFLGAIGSLINPHFKKFLEGLYGDGKKEKAEYLHSFMNSLDRAGTTIDPSNNAQYQSNAVLMGRPYALTRASLRLDLQGNPVYDQSWDNYKKVVDGYSRSGSYSPGETQGYTEVEFPIKIGNIAHTEDGLIGYFKENDYTKFYAPAETKENHGVMPPPRNNLQLNCNPSSTPEVISMIVEPRGSIHAYSGILPIKELNIPPNQYLDTLQKLNLCFLTTPILTHQERLAMPLPSEAGGEWSWIENDGQEWSHRMAIQAVTPNATMNYEPQRIVEGWLSLANRMLNDGNFSLLNKKTGKSELFTDAPATENVMLFSIKNNFKERWKLTGGPPVAGPYQDGGSSFLLKFENLLSNAVLEKLTITEESGVWQFNYILPDSGKKGYWSMAPSKDIALDPKEEVTFTISGITVAKDQPSSDVKIQFYGLPDLPDSFTPISIYIETIPPAK